MKAALIVLAIAMLGVAARADAQPSAESLYAEGQAAYDKADYTTAIAKWQASYQTSGENDLLFNLAQAMRLSGDCTRALATYQKFVAADPDPTSERHKLALDLARELEPACRARVPRGDPPISPPTGPQPSVGGGLNLVGGLNDHKSEGVRPGRTLRIAGLATSGVGASMLVTGLIFGRHAQTIGSEVTDACTTSCDWTVQKSKDAAGRRDATIGYALDAVGVAAIASGAVMYYLGSRSTVAVVPRPEGGVVASWRGSW
jgi:hypothetical protein